MKKTILLVIFVVATFSGCDQKSNFDVAGSSTKTSITQENTLAASDATINVITDTYPQRLDRILKEYKSLPQSTDVKPLVELDRELTALANEIQKKDREGTSASIWKKEYEDIGVYVGHYSNMIGYSGKLLVEAHAANPNSPYREYTLFTTILGEGSSHGLGEMPDIEQAKAYLKEFPHGPYATKTYFIIGSFYDDLAKVIVGLIEDENKNKGYEYDCFSSYLTNEPYQSQLTKAKALANEYLDKAIALMPENERKKMNLDFLYVKSGRTFAWHWCAD